MVKCSSHRSASGKNPWPCVIPWKRAPWKKYDFMLLLLALFLPYPSKNNIAWWMHTVFSVTLITVCNPTVISHPILLRKKNITFVPFLLAIINNKDNWHYYCWFGLLKKWEIRWWWRWYWNERRLKKLMTLAAGQTPPHSVPKTFYASHIITPPKYFFQNFNTYILSMFFCNRK